MFVYKPSKKKSFFCFTPKAVENKEQFSMVTDMFFFLNRFSSLFSISHDLILSNECRETGWMQRKIFGEKRDHFLVRQRPPLDGRGSAHSTGIDVCSRSQMKSLPIFES